MASDAPPEDTTPEQQSPTPYKYVPRISDDEVYGTALRRRFIGAIGALIALLLIAASIVYFYSRPKRPAVDTPASSSLLPASQWTMDGGVNLSPAFSHDGKLVAYSSDRDGPGNLAIWVRPYPSGAPRRLTKDAFHATDPDFSPDDKQVVYHSDRDGGIYIVPVSGGEPRLLAKDGFRPRFSPGGKWIAYHTVSAESSATPSSLGRIYIVAPEGGPPRQIQPDFALARYPVWLAGDDLLLMEGISASGVSDWWVTPVNGGNAARTFTMERLKNVAKHTGPERWSSGKILFGATTETNFHVWELPFEPPLWQASGTARQLSNTNGIDRAGAIGPDGRVMFTSIGVTADIWSLPLGASRSQPAATLQRLTDDHALDLTPVAGVSSGKIVYVSNKTGGRDLWIHDLKTGNSWASSSFHSVTNRPVLSPDETRVAYPTAIDNQCVVILQRLDQDTSRRVNSGCFNLWGWSPDASSLMISDPTEAVVSAQLWKIDSGQRQPLLSRPNFSLIEAGFSPDGKWIAFSGGRTMAAAEVYVAPFHGTAIKTTEWIPITREGGSVSAWSPDGSVLYYHSRRDGFHCIWAQQLDSAKRPVGDPYAIQHLHAASRGILRMRPSDFHMSVAKDRLIFNMATETSDLWITGKRD